MYLTLGNIPKALRRKPNSRACVLIAYLSVDKVSKEGMSQTALKLRNYEIFHRSMGIILESLKKAGDPKGSGIEMVGGDGALRRVYPLLAAYVADYPEQCLVTCTKYGTCPKCRRQAGELSLCTAGDPRTQKWTLSIIQKARISAVQPHRKKQAVHAQCMELDVAGGNYNPFWAGFPLTDIHRCITPDILHQLYQGVVKYLVVWVQAVMGSQELDSRIRSLPPAYGVRHFQNGISSLSQVSGPERKQIAKILLSCLVGKIDSRGIIACRSLLHWIHLAQYPSHDESTLAYMEEELNTWHTHRSFFIDAGVRENFDLPKFHSLLHYTDSIRWLGTTDNYNTELFERLHIDFAKEGWRASNKRDHFPQMVQWLSRQEKVSSYDFYRSWMGENKQKEDEEPMLQWREGPQIAEEIEVEVQVKRPGRIRPGALHPVANIVHLSKFPAEPKKPLARILVSHQAPAFLTHLKLYVASLLPSNQTVNQRIALASSLPFSRLDVWHQFRFKPYNLSDEESDGMQEIVKAVPISTRSSHPRFDTVLVLDTDEAESTAVQGAVQ